MGPGYPHINFCIRQWVIVRDPPPTCVCARAGVPYLPACLHERASEGTAVTRVRFRVHTWYMYVCTYERSTYKHMYTHNHTQKPRRARSEVWVGVALRDARSTVQIVQVQSELRPLLRPLCISVSPVPFSPTFLSTNSSLLFLTPCSSSSSSVPKATPAASHRITLAFAYSADSWEIGRKRWKRAGNVRNRFKWHYIPSRVIFRSDKTADSGALSDCRLHFDALHYNIILAFLKFSSRRVNCFINNSFQIHVYEDIKFIFFILINIIYRKVLHGVFRSLIM